MTDYAELRSALDVGPTPGPWFVHGSQGYAVATVGKIRIVADEFHIKIRPEDDATYIAAANPEVIRALLAERDAFADVLEAIASIKATPGRAKADALLASVVNLASAALAQEQGK